MKRKATRVSREQRGRWDVQIYQNGQTSSLTHPSAVSTTALAPASASASVTKTATAADPPASPGERSVLLAALVTLAASGAPAVGRVDRRLTGIAPQVVFLRVELQKQVRK